MGVENLDLGFIFSVAGSVAMMGWLILIFLPRRYDIIFFIPQFVIPFGLTIAYAGLLLPTIFAVDGGGFGSLTEVRTLFANDAALLGGWIHYLAFDLFIGAWIARRADALGLPRLLQTPILLATFMFGPLGLGLFLVVKLFYARVQGEFA